MAPRILAALFASLALGVTIAPADAQSPWCDRSLRALGALDSQSRQQVIDICRTVDRVQRMSLDQERPRQAKAAETEAKQPSEQECRTAYRAGCFAVLHRREVTDTAPVAPPPCKWCR